MLFANARIPEALFFVSVTILLQGSYMRIGLVTGLMLISGLRRTRHVEHVGGEVRP